MKKNNSKAVRFTKEELEKIEKAVLKFNNENQFGRITSSDIIRKGSLDFSKKIMLSKKVRMVFEK